MRFSVPALLLLLAAAPSTPLTAGTATFDFEGFPDSTILTSQYSSAVTFGDAIILTAGITLNEFEFPPHSGSNVASDNGGPMTISFAPPVQSFRGYFTYSEPLTVRAFNSTNSQVAVATSGFSDNEALSGSAGSSPNELLQVSSAGGIASVTIIGDPAGTSFTLDDATITGLAAPPATPLPPTLPLVSVGLLLAGIWAFVARKKQRMSVQRIALTVLFLLPLGFVTLRLSAGPQASPRPEKGATTAAAIRSTSATPTSIRTHTPTRVLVSAHISRPAVIPGSVNLIRVNPDGPPTIIGRLHDDGREGNATAGDEIYSIRPILNGLAAGKIQLRISVALRGQMRRVLSEPITLTITPGQER
jgi:hypothetical protein